MTDSSPYAEPPSAPSVAARPGGRAGLILAGALLVLSSLFGVVGAVNTALLMGGQFPGLGGVGSLASIIGSLLFFGALVFAAVGMPGAPALAGRGGSAVLPMIAVLAYALIAVLQRIASIFAPSAMAALDLDFRAIQAVLGGLAIVSILVLIVAAIGVILVNAVTGFARWSLLVPVAALLLAMLPSLVPSLEFYLVAQFVVVVSWLVAGISWLFARPRT